MQYKTIADTRAVQNYSRHTCSTKLILSQNIQGVKKKQTWNVEADFETCNILFRLNSKKKTVYKWRRATTIHRESQKTWDTPISLLQISALMNKLGRPRWMDLIKFKKFLTHSSQICFNWKQALPFFLKCLFKVPKSSSKSFGPPSACLFFEELDMYNSYWAKGAMPHPLFKFWPLCTPHPENLPRSPPPPC